MMCHFQDTPTIPSANGAATETQVLQKSTFESKETQTRLEGGTPQRYQALRNAQEPDKEARKNQKRYKNKKNKKKRNQHNQSNGEQERQQEESAATTSLDTVSPSSSNSGIIVNVDAPTHPGGRLFQSLLHVDVANETLSDDLNRAAMYMEGEIDRIDKRSKLGRQLYDTMLKLGKAEAGDEEQQLIREVKKLRAQWLANS